jgi:hypothetical protein
MNRAGNDRSTSGISKYSPAFSARTDGANGLSGSRNLILVTGGGVGRYRVPLVDGCIDEIYPTLRISHWSFC